MGDVDKRRLGAQSAGRILKSRSAFPIVPRPEGAQGAERRCFFFPRLFLCDHCVERKKLAGKVIGIELLGIKGRFPFEDLSHFKVDVSTVA
jgi:hypothetical protein